MTRPKPKQMSLKAPGPACTEGFTAHAPLVEATFDPLARAAGYDVPLKLPLRHQCDRDLGHKGVHRCACGVGDWPQDLDANDGQPAIVSPA